MDTEYLLRLLEQRATGDIEADLTSVLRDVEGSYALGILLPDRLIAVRDRSGNRPLSIGKAGESWFISSESCAFSNVEAQYVADVDPGTMVIFDADGMRVVPFDTKNERKCRFEGIYYAHPASRVFDEEVGRFRMAVGRELERLFPVPGADIVMPVPDSANFIALGFGESGRSGLFLPAISRSHYVGRSFIAATQADRDLEVAQKFTVAAGEVRGKRVVIIDDSIVRGTTLPRVVNMLRFNGASEVHVRIGSPPITHPCRYGINTPQRGELIASSHNGAQIKAWAGADSLAFLPLEALQELSPRPESFCFACMNGKYW